MSQLQNLRKQVLQLRQEANISRMPVSQACDDLMKYCSEHQKSDVLVFGISQSENPFKENKGCILI
uniref:Guanine nucleotide-binding protein subunit gamma n=1 Tax=Parasteatoda tepidariorum TaxID=114398 RepID=A0A2L2YAV6_PARTP